MRNLHHRQPLVDVLRGAPKLPPTLAFLAILGVALLTAIVESGARLSPTLWAVLFSLIVASGTIVGHNTPRGQP